MKPVTEKELEDVLSEMIILENKNTNKRQTTKILDEIINRCVANRQNFPELFKKCHKKVLSSKEFKIAATTSKSGNKRTTRKESVLSEVVRMVREGKSDEEIDKFLKG